MRERAPDTVRIMLTGNADLEGAIKVVNEGNIFRFLTKPCALEILGKAVEDALTQYRLVTAEKELLNKTLSGSIKLLNDILSMMEPQSFGRAQTMRDIISSVTKKFKTDNDWEIPLAVMLAPIGNVTIPPELLLRARAGGGDVQGRGTDRGAVAGNRRAFARQHSPAGRRRPHRALPA